MRTVAQLVLVAKRLRLGSSLSIGLDSQSLQGKFDYIRKDQKVFLERGRALIRIFQGAVPVFLQAHKDCVAYGKLRHGRRFHFCRWIKDGTSEIYL